MMKDKVAIITGANRGIGLAVAERLAEDGCNIVINYLFDTEGSTKIVEKLESLGVKAIAVQGDISKFSDCERIVSETVKEFGKVDILVNNAGITKDKLMMRMSEDDFDAVINVNLKGTWNMVKQVTRLMMKQRSGRIINLASVVALTGNAGQANYVASKAGIIGMTKTLAKEFGPRGVTVNAIAPGFIQTDMTDVLSDEVKNEFIKNVPLGCLGKPRDIANTVAFLASEDARYITGQTISVNGGMV
ncbi:3-oxoacyl-[acyl-carrier-protein] reductase [Mycoplasmatota bacterium WC44]